MRYLVITLLIACGWLGFTAHAQGDDQSKERQQLRDELRAKVRARLQQLERELFEEIDRALATERSEPPVQPTQGTDQGFLGVSIRELKPGMRELLGVPAGVGVLIDEVVPESPAHAAGLRRTDVLLSWNGQPTHSEADLARVAATGRIGQAVKLVVLRQGQRLELTATLAARGARVTVPATDTDPAAALQKALEGGGLQELLEKMQQQPEMQKMLEQAMQQLEGMMKDPEARKQLEEMLRQFGGGQNPDELQKALEQMLGKGEQPKPADQREPAKQDDIEKMLDDLLGKPKPEAQPVQPQDPKTQPAAERHAAWLGVSLRPLDETMRTQLGLGAGEGILVESIVDESPAARAGLQAFDVLLAWNQTQLGSIDALKQAVLAARAGDKIKLLVLRKGERLTLEVELAARPAEAGWR